MKKFTLSLILKIYIIIFALCGLYMCAYIYPENISVSQAIKLITTPQSHILLGFYWLTSIPCFVILIFAWKIANAVKKETVFTAKTARSIKICTIILSIDLAVYIVGNVAFLGLSWHPLAFNYLLIAMLGVAFASVAAVLSYYTFKAAALKEETEGVI